jgi:LCP family protein required for cell wall assembly
MGAAFFIYLENKEPELELKELKKQEAQTINKALSVLILGVDSLIPGKLAGWNGRSDSIVVLYVNPHTKVVSVISVPRDTYTDLKKLKTHKINAANQVGGYKLTKKAVTKLLGLEIDHVVVFSIKAVIDLIDAMGDIKIYVPQKMSYHDHSANLHIEIEPGLQVMNGKQLMNFLRYRSKLDGDIGRIQRQHIFFRAAVKQLSKPQTAFRMPTMLLKANKTFISDMSFKEMFELGILLRSLLINKDDKTKAKWGFKSYIVPGDFGEKGYWLPNQEKIKEMILKIKY